MQLRIADGRIRLFTRRGFDWTARYSWVVESAKALRVKSATIDGELVCAGKDGVADFSKLHSRCHDGEAFLYAFDLIEHDGENLRGQTLDERKRRLGKLIRRAPPAFALSIMTTATARACLRRPVGWAWRASSARGWIAATIRPLQILGQGQKSEGAERFARARRTGRITANGDRPFWTPTPENINTLPLPLRRLGYRLSG